MDKTDGSMDVVKELESLGNELGTVQGGSKPKIVDCGELPEEDEQGPS